MIVHLPTVLRSYDIIGSYSLDSEGLYVRSGRIFIVQYLNRTLWRVAKVKLFIMFRERSASGTGVIKTEVRKGITLRAQNGEYR